MKLYILITLLIIVVVILIVLKLKTDTKSNPKENFKKEDSENDDISCYKEKNKDSKDSEQINSKDSEQINSKDGEQINSKDGELMNSKDSEQNPFDGRCTNTSFYSAKNDSSISNSTVESNLSADNYCTDKSNCDDKSIFTDKRSNSTYVIENSYSYEDYIYAPYAYEKFLAEIADIQEIPNPKTFDDFVFSCIPSFLRNIENFFSSLKLKITINDLGVLNFRVLLFFRKRLVNEIEIVCKNLKRSRRFRKLVVYLHLILREFCDNIIDDKLEDLIIKLDKLLVKIKIDEEFRKRLELIINMCYRILQINKSSDNEHFKLIGLSFYIITEQVCNHTPNLFTENTWKCTFTTILDGVKTAGNNFNPLRQNKSNQIYENYNQATLWGPENENSNSDNQYEAILKNITSDDLYEGCFCKGKKCKCGAVMINETVLKCTLLDSLNSDVTEDLETEYGWKVLRILYCLEGYADKLRIIRKNVSRLGEIQNNKIIEWDGVLSEKRYLRKSLENLLADSYNFDNVMENLWFVLHSLEPEYDRIAYGHMKNSIFNINKLLPEMLKKVINHVR